ncbi:MAG: histidine phosphatase family protein [Firmicutes bacterium]|nr:histidine phosphatase family protein [Bacillota bacterium]
MKIIMIRHAKVDMEWEKTYNSKGWDKANEAYNAAPIKSIDKRLKIEGFRVYISALPRTRATANGLFGDCELIETPLLNEVPNRAAIDTEKKLPKKFWVARGRTQWYMNSSRQWETRKMTRDRAEELVKMLVDKNEDCVLVTHEFFLYTLKSVLEKHGFVIKRSNTGRIKNLERIRATKRDDHCGFCTHNCLLSNPGCDIGKERAIAQSNK